MRAAVDVGVMAPRVIDDEARATTLPSRSSSKRAVRPGGIASARQRHERGRAGGFHVPPSTRSDRAGQRPRPGVLRWSDDACRRRARPDQDVQERMAAAPAHRGAPRRDARGAPRRHLRPARVRTAPARPPCSRSWPRSSCPTVAPPRCSVTTWSARRTPFAIGSTWPAATRPSSGACDRPRCSPSTGGSTV